MSQQGAGQLPGDHCPLGKAMARCPSASGAGTRSHPLGGPSEEACPCTLHAHGVMGAGPTWLYRRTHVILGLSTPKPLSLSGCQKSDSSLLLAQSLAELLSIQLTECQASKPALGVK